jgi:hypothetical protein
MTLLTTLCYHTTQYFLPILVLQATVFFFGIFSNSLTTSPSNSLASAHQVTEINTTIKKLNSLGLILTAETESWRNNRWEPKIIRDLFSLFTSKSVKLNNFKNVKLQKFAQRYFSETWRSKMLRIWN